MSDPVAGKAVLQGLDHRTLAHNLFKGLWSRFSGENEIGHVAPGEGKEPLSERSEKDDSRAPPRHTKRVTTVASSRTWRGS